MSFSTPTTKAEMYATLKDIFYYYRVKREGYEGVTLSELNLVRLSFTPLSDTEISQRASQALSAKHTQFQAEYVDNLQNKLSLATAKLSALPNSILLRQEKIESDYNKSLDKIRQETAKQGLTGSTIVVDKLAKLESEKIKLLDELTAQQTATQTQLNAEISAINLKLENAESYCTQIFSQEILAKSNELKDEQDKLEREIFKYNNGLDEKEQRYSNTILQANANLELRFLEIRAGEFTKDELVQMGYYEDVIACVCAYYDTLEAFTAAQEIMRDTKLPVYLDDYYETIVYMYQQRAI